MNITFAFKFQLQADDFPNFPGSRFMLLGWWLFSLVAVTSYTASITAGLTSKLDFLPIGSIGELLDDITG